MMFRLLNALERVVSLENVVGNIAVNLSSQLQIIVEKIETLDQKVEALRKVNVHKMAAADFDHHKSVVETNFKELPVKSTTVVEAMDVSLRDNQPGLRQRDKTYCRRQYYCDKALRRKHGSF